MHYLIYKVTNKVNNRFYVGMHKTENKGDKYLGSGLLLARAIQKYGRQNFVREILFECASEEEMTQREIDIVDADFIAREDTYNVALGGRGGGLTQSDRIEGNRLGNKAMWARYRNDEEFRMEYALKRSIIAKARNEKWGNPSKGKLASAETRKKMSDSHKGKTVGENNGNFGKHWITNGTGNILVKNNTIPDGWRKGRIVT